MVIAHLESIVTRKCPNIGNLVQWDSHFGVVEKTQGIDIMVYWVVPINNLPGCSLPCTHSWLTRADVEIIS